MTGGAALSRTEMLSGATAPFLNAPHTQPAGTGGSAEGDTLQMQYCLCFTFSPLSQGTELSTLSGLICSLCPMAVEEDS